MPIDDPLLPAARHLVGADATSLLETAVASCGGWLRRAETVQVQHRPGHDLVVRYDAQVAWGGEPARRETLMAASTVSGAPAGTLVLTAGDLVAGVWRYPFDPLLPGLADAVSPARASRLLPRRLGPSPDLAVVAYRPMRRAVVRASGHGQHAYLKVVPPPRTAGIAARHEALRAAGLPAPLVEGVDEARGLLVLAALPGENLRDRLLRGTDRWPTAAAHVELLQRLASVPLPASPTIEGGTLTEAQIARSHARALASILPVESDRLDRITSAVGSVTDEVPHTATIHGDLYEAQLMVDRVGHLTGLLDLDDVRIGHVLDDAATMLAHLHILQPPTRRHRAHLEAYRERLRVAFADAFVTGDEARELDVRTASVLLGLATGPFRAQREQWEQEVRRRIAIADGLVESARRAPREKTLRHAS